MPWCIKDLNCILKFQHTPPLPTLDYLWVVFQIQWINCAPDREKQYLVLHGACEALGSGWWFKHCSPAWAIIMRPMRTNLCCIKFTSIGLRVPGNRVQWHLSSSVIRRSASAWFTVGLPCPKPLQHPCTGPSRRTQCVRYPPAAVARTWRTAGAHWLH